MKENCLDVGIIQAFLDGEISHTETARVSGHIAVCDACAAMLAEAEDESAIVFPALEREFNTMVPTQRLWNKINDSLATERERGPFWKKAWAFPAVAIANQSLAAAAGFLIVIGIFAAVWMNRNPVSSEIAMNEDPVSTTPSTTTISSTGNTATPATLDSLTGEQVTVETPEPPAKFVRTDYRPDNRRGISSSAVSSSAANSGSYMPGEESYVKTIASLNKTVDEQKDGVLRPGERMSYERDMAVVDDAITKMRKEVKRNPKNESAKQVLYSSYQNKIDLLNSVAQKEELVASLR